MNTRNYNKEEKRQKEINEVFKVKISKDLAKRLREKLEIEGKTYSSFARDMIIKYIEKEY